VDDDAGSLHSGFDAFARRQVADNKFRPIGRLALAPTQYADLRSCVNEPPHNVLTQGAAAAGDKNRCGHALSPYYIRTVSRVACQTSGSLHM
jgi:hypothetical protein